jgi:hypothetical protein
MPFSKETLAMAQVKHCEMPTCSGFPLIKLTHESSWTTAKAYCSNPKCGRIYTIPTMAGKAAPVAPLATLGLLAWSVFSLDIEEAIEHGGNAIEHFLG